MINRKLSGIQEAYLEIYNEEYTPPTPPPVPAEVRKSTKKPAITGHGTGRPMHGEYDNPDEFPGSKNAKKSPTMPPPVDAPPPVYGGPDKGPSKYVMSAPKNPPSVKKEEFDLFDYLLEYLIAEGYADTNQNAIVIMANMSEEWKQSIVEEFEQLDEGAAGDVADRALKLSRQRKGQTPEQKEMYRRLSALAAERERGPFQRGNTRSRLSQDERTERREADVYDTEINDTRRGGRKYGPGEVTKNPRKLARQIARGEHA